MTPIVQPLAKWQRTLIFLLLLSAFLVSLPAFIFYATGYRYDFFADEPTITATGGLYISADAQNSLIYIDEKPVTNVRVFRKASYIQGLLPGVQRVHVQSLGLHTWVKELSVLPHIVTEAEAFNLPLRPQVRPITEYSLPRGENVIFATTTSKEVFIKASSSILSIAATGTATSSYLSNSEFSVLKLLFKEKEDLLKAKQELAETKFSFSTTSATSTILGNATTTKIRGNLTLYQRGEDIFAAVIDPTGNVPYYFCTPEGLPSSLIDTKEISTETELFDDTQLSELDKKELANNCRSEIRLDRKWQEVIAFDFFPQNPNLVVMHLTEGIYIVEIDDRSWQNMQILYPGSDLMMLISNNSIFVKEKDFMFEVLTEIPLP